MAQIKFEGKTKDVEIHCETFYNKNPRVLGNRTQTKKNWETNGLTSRFNSRGYKVHTDENLICWSQDGLWQILK